MGASAFLRCSDEVAQALSDGKGVVALESTILAHGFPHPEGRALADELEAEVRVHGAVPATIAVIRGRLCVGLTASELDHITDPAVAVAKSAALDLAVHGARGDTAATTVSATCFAAAAAGIRFFATGGIGGVHRGDSGDVSSDLGELARSKVAVVSAGAKSILDLPRTLEALETLGVLVVGFGTDELPAFYLSSSGLPLTHRVDDGVALAELVRWRFDRLGQGGLLVCNPIDPEHALDADEIAAVIDAAIADAEARGIGGKGLTPHLLAQVADKTAGRSVVANRALALGNARVAAEAAAAYVALGPQDLSPTPSS